MKRRQKETKANSSAFDLLLASLNEMLDERRAERSDRDDEDTAG